MWTSQEQKEVVVHQSEHNPSEQTLDLLRCSWLMDQDEWAVDVCASWAGSIYRKYDSTAVDPEICKGYHAACNDEHRHKIFSRS